MDNPRLSARGAANEDENRKRLMRIRNVKFFVFIATMMVITFILYLSNHSLVIKVVAYVLSMAILDRILELPSTLNDVKIT